MGHRALKATKDIREVQGRQVLRAIREPPVLRVQLARKVVLVLKETKELRDTRAIRE